MLLNIIDSTASDKVKSVHSHRNVQILLPAYLHSICVIAMHPENSTLTVVSSRHLVRLGIRQARNIAGLNIIHHLHACETM